MKRTRAIILSLIFIYISSFNQYLKAEPAGDVDTKIEKSHNYSSLVSRVFEIREMDRSLMSRGEKKELKQELRLIKNELNDIRKAEKTNDRGPVIYISLGTILLIIIILILVL